MDWLAVAGAVVAGLALGMLSIALLRARREVRRFAVLDEVARVSDRAEDVQATLEAICEVLVPGVADFCMVDVIADGRVTRAATRVSARGG